MVVKRNIYKQRLFEQTNKYKQINKRIFMFIFIRLTSYINHIRSFMFMNILNKHKQKKNKYTQLNIYEHK